MPILYPLRFEPLFRRYLWGGRRLGTLLGKPIGPGDDYAESWEVVDRGDDQSRVTRRSACRANSPRTGHAEWRRIVRPPCALGRFPLLFKILDANRDLSVQVHPNDAQAAQLGLSDPGKTEAWVILAAEPGSVIYAGLKQGVDRRELKAALADGTCDPLLHQISPKPGDCLLLQAGAVHALGAGILVAEIQQSSDTTFRLYDWNRVGPHGQPRQLHIEQALAVTDYTRGPLDVQKPRSTNQEHIERLAECDKFVLERWTLTELKSLPGDDRFHLLHVVEGQLQIEGDAAAEPLRRGETLLVPACSSNARLMPRGEAILLDMYLP